MSVTTVELVEEGDATVDRRQLALDATGDDDGVPLSPGRGRDRRDRHGVGRGAADDPPRVGLDRGSVEHGDVLRQPVARIAFGVAPQPVEEGHDRVEGAVVAGAVRAVVCDHGDEGAPPDLVGERGGIVAVGPRGQVVAQVDERVQLGLGLEVETTVVGARPAPDLAHGRGVEPGQRGDEQPVERLWVAVHPPQHVDDGAHHRLFGDQAGHRRDGDAVAGERAGHGGSTARRPPKQHSHPGPLHAVGARREQLTRDRLGLDRRVAAPHQLGRSIEMPERRGELDVGLLDVRTRHADAAGFGGQPVEQPAHRGRARLVVVDQHVVEAVERARPQRQHEQAGRVDATAAVEHVEVAARERGELTPPVVERGVACREGGLVGEHGLGDLVDERGVAEQGMERRPFHRAFAVEQLAHDGALLRTDEETHGAPGADDEVVRHPVVRGDRKRVEAARQVGEHRIAEGQRRGAVAAQDEESRRVGGPREAHVAGGQRGRLARARCAAHAHPPLVVVDHLLLRGRQLHRRDLTSGP